jgi:intracellular sulfur oxidation DsrE/DsrF family protein
MLKEELVMHKLKLISMLIMTFTFVLGTLSASVYAAGNNHKIAIHLDENDKSRMNLVLNNAQNVNAYYLSKGDTVEIEVVTYGPGLHMLRADTSPVKARIAAMSLEMENLTFAGCQNTQAKMEKKAGKKISLVSEAKMVPSGVVRLIELQENGWAYIRP